MRHRVEAKELPVPLHAVWTGEVYPAQRSSTDGTVLLVAETGQAPEGFDTEWNGAPAKVVSDETEAATFSVQTHCRFDDEIFRVERVGEDGLHLRWTGHDETTAAELGLTDFTTVAQPDEVTALWQQRHDFPGEVSARPPAGGDQTALLHTIGRTLARLRRDDTFTVGAQFRQVGDYSELEVRAVADDVVVVIAPPVRLGQAFTELRSAMYVEGAGTWLQGTFTLNPGTSFDFDFDSAAEPQWRLPPHEGGRPMTRTYSAELTQFPRRRDAVPPWLAAKAGLPLDLTFRTAKVVDAHPEGERPVVNRQPVPPEEVRPLLDYLYRSPVVLTRGAPLPDIFTPTPRPDVPDAFHTDGSWIWPAAVPHYLRKYGLPPEPDLLEHIRANRHHPPYVSERVRATAEAEVQGKPYPPQTEADLGIADPVTRVERGDEVAPRLRAGEVLTVLRKRLREHGVTESAYHLGDPAEDTPDDTWVLRRTGQGWEVAARVGGNPFQPKYFERAEEAAQYLLGALLLYPARAAAEEPAEPADRPLAQPLAQSLAQPQDWPILPMRGEPPLNLLRHKRMLRLSEGTVVRRFGPEAGNLVHEHGATFAQTALLPDRERERHTYVLRRPLWVLAGVAAPWDGMPGGALAYLLPRPIAQHVDTGALARQ